MTQFTISQALRRVKKLKGEIAEHDARAKSGVSYVKETPPIFLFKDEVEMLEKCQNEMMELESRIALANATNKVKCDDVEMPLTLAIRKLQETKGRIAFYKGLHLRNEVIKTRELEWNEEKNQNVYVPQFVTYVSDCTAKDRDMKVRTLQDYFEKLNNVVETANHSILC